MDLSPFACSTNRSTEACFTNRCTEPGIHSLTIRRRIGGIRSVSGEGFGNRWRLRCIAKGLVGSIAVRRISHDAPPDTLTARSRRPSGRAGTRRGEIGSQLDSRSGAQKMEAKRPGRLNIFFKSQVLNFCSINPIYNVSNMSLGVCKTILE